MPNITINNQTQNVNLSNGSKDSLICQVMTINDKNQHQ